MAVLSAEKAFYEEHKETLVRDHPNRFVLIYGAELKGVFDTEDDAIDAGYRMFGEGPYLVRKTGQEAPKLSNPALSLGVPFAVVR